MVGAAVVGACVWTTVFADISVVDDTSLTDAAARELLVGAFNSIDAIAFDRVLLETAVVSSDTSSALRSPEACPAIGEITIRSQGQTIRSNWTQNVGQSVALRASWSPALLNLLQEKLRPETSALQVVLLCRY